MASYKCGYVSITFKAKAGEHTSDQSGFWLSLFAIGFLEVNITIYRSSNNSSENLTQARLFGTKTNP
jgi:hypothetical protein